MTLLLPEIVLILVAASHLGQRNRRTSQPTRIIPGAAINKGSAPRTPLTSSLAGLALGQAAEVQRYIIQRMGEDLEEPTTA